MKWLPRSKKSWIILVVIVLAAAVAGFFIVRSGKNTPPEDTTVSKETKVASILTALSEDETYTSFHEFLGGMDIAAKIVPDAAGALPELVIFAPNNAAFEGESMAPLKSVAEPLKNELRLYHMALLYPAADGTTPDLSLKEGQKIATLAGRELNVKKNGSRFILVDVKGRETKVNASYTTDEQGYRLYTIDSALLLQ